jgi:hypothetical protein
MVTRIRYAAIEGQGILQSVRALPTTTGKDIFVQLRAETLTFTIVDAASGDMLAVGTAVSMPQLKLKAKDAARGLGVAFAEEGRDRAPKAVAVEVPSES